MKIEVNITKTKLFVLIISLFVLGGMIFAFAYGTNNPQVFGHSANEVEITLANGTVTNLQQAISNNLFNDGQQINFISPVIVTANNTGIGRSWTTYDASSSVPSTAKAVILEAEGVIDGPNCALPIVNSSGMYNGSCGVVNIMIRKDSSSNKLLLLSAAAAWNADAGSAGGQGIFPLSSSKTFQYEVGNYNGDGNSVGFSTAFSYPNGGYVIRLIGYIS